MRRLFVWFYEVCLRMNEISNGGPLGKRDYKEWELPSKDELAQLDREFKERNKPGHKPHHKE